MLGLAQVRQGFEDRLSRRLEEVDAALQRMRADARAGLDGLRDVAGVVRRLEAKLDRLSEAAMALPKAEAGRAGANGEWAAASGRAAAESAAGVALAQEGGVHTSGGGLPPGADERLALSIMRSPSLLSQPGKDGRVPETPTGRLGEDDHGLLAGLDRKVERIAAEMGVHFVASVGDDNEDRKRLKEKLKAALDRQTRTIVKQQEDWLEFMFGICKPDGRVGKRGSRCFLRLAGWAFRQFAHRVLLFSNRVIANIY